MLRYDRVFVQHDKMSGLMHGDSSDKQSVRRIFEGIGLWGRCRIRRMLSIVDRLLGQCRAKS